MQTGIFNAFSTVRPVMETLTGVPTFSVPVLLSTLSQISMVVLPGSSAGLMSETLARRDRQSRDTESIALVADFHLLRETLRDVRLGQQRGCVHHGDQRCAGGCGFAGIERTVCDYTVDGAANLGVGDLRFGAFVFAFGRRELALART